MSQNLLYQKEMSVWCSVVFLISREMTTVSIVCAETKNPPTHNNTFRQFLVT